MFIVFIFLVNLIYALVSPLGKVALQYSTPMFLAAFRMILAGVLTLGYQICVKKEKVSIPREHLWSLFLGGALSIYVAGILEFCGLEYLAPSKISFLYNLYPMSSALISYFMVKERLTVEKWLGLAVGFMGAIPLLLSKFEGDSHLYKYFGLLSLSEISILGAIFACPMGWIPVQVDISHNKYSTNLALGLTQIIGGLIALVNSICLDCWDPWPVFNGGYFLLTAVILTFFSNILANALYIELLKRHTYTLIAFSGFLTSFMTAFIDWAVFGYGIDSSFFISTVITLIGFYLFYRDEIR